MTTFLQTGETLDDCDTDFQDHELTFQIQWDGQVIELSFPSLTRLSELKDRLYEITEIQPESQKLLGLPLAKDNV
jgi:hypothetical protein